MAQVRSLKESDLKLSTVSQEIGKEAQNPLRKLKLCTYEKGTNDFWYRVIVDIQEEEFQIFDNNNNENARKYFYACLDIIPCFWSPRSLSHLKDIFTVKVLTKLVELIEQHGSTWSIAHMCVSLPLPEETMLVLLTSDSFRDHFTSTCHPKGYTILHLAVELNSVSACRTIIQCGNQWPELRDKAHNLHVKDMEGVVPIQKAIVCKAWACVDYLVQSLSLQPPPGLETPPLLGGEMFQRARNLQGMKSLSLQPPSGLETPPLLDREMGMESLSLQPPSGLETPPSLIREMGMKPLSLQPPSGLELTCLGAGNLQAMNGGTEQSSSTRSIKLKKTQFHWFGDKSVDLHEARDPEVSSCTVQ